MADHVLNYVLGAFESQGYEPGLRGEIAWLPGEAFITLTVSEPTPALRQLARAMESEFDELGRNVHIQVRRPARSLWGWLARWSRTCRAGKAHGAALPKTTDFL